MSHQFRELAWRLGLREARVGSRAAAFCLALGLNGMVMLAPLAPAQIRSNTEIVANVELVQVSVVVFNGQGAVAGNLGKNDFRIVDDGVEQKILHCDRERVPVSFVILADLSSSMTRKIPFVVEAALSLVEPPEGEDQSVDEYSVFGIDTRAKLLFPFTRDENDLEQRLPLLLQPTNGSTALFDGIYFGVSTAERQASNEQRAMIIISDGGDNHSRYNLNETKRMLEEADVPVFAVMAGPSLDLPPFLLPPEQKTGRFPIGGPAGNSRAPDGRPAADYIGPAELHGPRNLKTLTEASGGGVFTATELDDLPRIVRTIGEAVRFRYVLSYKPVRDPKLVEAREKVPGDPNKHKIRLELVPKEKFKGYYVPYYKRVYRSFPPLEVSGN
jgi:Ca-activated chloride channel homolog